MTIPKIVPGPSTLHPGRAGGIDPGHPENHEVFYVNREKVLMHNTQTNEFYELHENGITPVYEGEPRELIDIGADVVVTI